MNRVKNLCHIWISAQVFVPGKAIEMSSPVSDELCRQLGGNFGDFDFGFFVQGGSPLAMVGLVGTSNHSESVSPRLFNGGRA